jgi:TDG/mug DNA glycosylase family protein
VTEPIAVRRPTPTELEAAVGTTVRDLLAPGLDVVFCGINPGLYSGATGHHFARPGNRFWKTLHGAGFTPELLSPDEDERLVAFGLGITNIVPRTTRGEADLTADELRAGAARLAESVRVFSPRALAVLGIGAYRTAFKRRGEIGRQPEGLGDTAVYVLPNPSGLQARYQLPELIDLFRSLREELAAGGSS